MRVSPEEGERLLKRAARFKRGADAIEAMGPTRRPKEKAAPGPRQDSDLEVLFRAQLESSEKLHAMGLVMMRNHRFLQAEIGRGWELDFAWPELVCAVEVDGNVHRIKGRFKADIEKHAMAILHGWTILRVGGDQIRRGEALNWTLMMLEKRIAAAARESA